MDRYPHSDFEAAISKLPEFIRHVPVINDLPGAGKLGAITGYSYDKLLNCLLYIQPWNTELAQDHVLRITQKQRLDIGAQRFESMKHRIRDGYNLIPGARIQDRPQHLIVLPKSIHLYTHLVNFGMVSNVIKSTKETVKIKPHPDTTNDILEALEKEYPGKVLPKDDALYPYVRAAKKLWITTQSEVGIAGAFHNKAVDFIDNQAYKGAVPSLRTLYVGLFNSPVRIGLKDKLIRCLSYPESGLIPVGTGTEGEDIRHFFTQYVLHRHVGG